MKRFIQILIFQLLIIASCDRVQYFPDKPIIVEKTLILSHKGGGSFDDGNTFEGCKQGFAKLDGIECDVQRSSDNVLWLSHSSEVPSCGSYSGSCFASLSSNTIIQIDSCLGKEKDYTQLEKVFQYMSTYYPQKFISLDVKAWTPCGLSGVNITKEMNELAQKIITLTKKYNLENKVMVESETGDFLYYIKTHTDAIETYLSTSGDFELGVSRALKAGFSGISFDYAFKDAVSKDLIALIHQKGLKIQLWTVDEAIDEAISLNADYIQTDSINFLINNP